MSIRFSSLTGWIAIVSAICLILLSANTMDEHVARLLKATSIPLKGIKISFVFPTNSQKKNEKYSNPKLMFYNHSLPQILTVRGVWSRGIVLISQGAISLLTEKELLSIIEIAQIKIQRTEVVTKTFFSFLTYWILKATPKCWANLIFYKRIIEKNPSHHHLSLWSAFLFVFFYSFIRFFHSTAKESLPIFSDNELIQRNFLSAKHKIEKEYKLISFQDPFIDLVSLFNQR